MAPSVFGVYLSTDFHCAFLPPHGITLHTRHGGNLFNLAWLRVEMKTNTFLNQELMFANNVAFCACNVPKLQEMCNGVSASCCLFGLKISTKKTVMLATNGPPPSIQIIGELLAVVV